MIDPKSKLMRLLENEVSRRPEGEKEKMEREAVEELVKRFKVSGGNGGERMINHDEFYPLLKPYINEVDRLNKIIERQKKEIEKRDERIDELREQNSDLLYNHEKSELERDKPLMAKWRVQTDGGGGKHTFMMCPKCGKLISNWQGYCELCGQRISDKFEYLPENEVKDENPNN